ncbi:MAG TPA: amidase family protein, partial [Burkholderiales bacterium]|nr:amidase family protein [Burkholderiales bacterium]
MKPSTRFVIPARFFSAFRSVALCFLVLLASCATAPQSDTADYTEATIAELHAQMRAGTLTSEALTRWYLQRIEAIDRAGPALNAIIEVNPDALRIARSLDRKWRESGAQGPLHGIPVVLKANIDTGDAMATSAGSLALANHHAPDDAHMVARLRAAGAVILGKANLSEWANFRSSHSSSGWSSLGGQTKNPYTIGRNPCGSSSGSAVAVAANLATLAIGTETDGSVVCPAGLNGVVGIKPSLGVVSRDGIIPIAHSQDTAGPMAGNVRDAAILLAVMAGSDLGDPITVDAPRFAPAFIESLSPDALKGKLIGVIRSHY